MPIVTIPSAGQYGLNADTLPQELPVNAWSAGTNVRFFNGAVERVGGHVPIFTTPTITPYYITPYTTSTARFWVHAGLAKVFVDDGTTQTEITNVTPFTGAIDDRWTGGSLNGVLVLNNGVDQPQFWGGNIANKLVVVTGWDSNWRCKFFRPFKNFLIAGDITKSSTRYPHMIKWSHECDPGTITGSGDWNEADPAKDAGEQDLAETPDLLVDALPMGDQLIVYKERSMYSMQYIGSPLIWQFRRLPGDVGMLAKGCAVNTPAGHVVLSAGDVVIHQGTGSNSVLDAKWRKQLFLSMDSINYKRSFLVTIPRKSEVWVCYPEVGQTTCTAALIYNWVTGAIGHRALPTATYGATGQINITNTDLWSSDSIPWSQSYEAWNANEYAANEGRTVLSSAVPKLYLPDSGFDFDGTNITATLERTGLAFDAPDQIKLVKSITPRVDAMAGTVLTIQAGGAMDVEQVPVWGPAVTYTVGTSRKADVFATGRFISYRISSSSVQGWRIHSLGVDVTPQGNY